MKWHSFAKWPAGSIVQKRADDVTTDQHLTESAAKAVCKMLERDGLGGEGKVFPLETWVVSDDNLGKGKVYEGGYPRPTEFLCQCGGELVVEHSTSGNLADEHDIYRVRCRRCPMSSRWLCHEFDCLEEIFNGMETRRKDNGKQKGG